MPNNAIQTSGEIRVWGSLDGSFKHPFLKLDLDSEPDKYPGIVILTNADFANAEAFAVQDLSVELPVLLKKVYPIPVVFWWLEPSSDTVQRILSGLTERPVILDRAM